MKTVILAGGFGTRLSEYTESIPKPMVEVGGSPLITHLMQHYARFGYDEFFLALGYKAEYVKDYFSNLNYKLSDYCIDFSTASNKVLKGPKFNWRVSLIDTGQKTMTGGRLRRLKEYLSDGTFMVTYGDGLSDIDISDLVKFHKSHGKMATITAVRPVARFGEITIDGGSSVKTFHEKPQIQSGWINGGFMVFEPKFLDLIDGDDTVLERRPLEEAARIGQLMAYQHTGFWHCMDTKRDKDYLDSLYSENRP